MPAIFYLLDLMLSAYHIAKAHSIPTHIFKVLKQNQKIILNYGKVEETFFILVKKAKKIVIFRD